MKPIPLKESDFIARRDNRIQFLFQLVALLTATVSVLLAVPLAWKTPDSLGLPSAVQQSQATQAQIDSMKAEVASLRMALSAVQSAASAASGAQVAGSIATELGQVQASVQGLASRLEKLENAILANPAKALEIPLILRDIEGLRASQATAINAMKDGVDRLYDINKWLLGAMAVSIVTLAISNFLRPKEASGKKDTSEA
jgi:hypothetical protein